MIHHHKIREIVDEHLGNLIKFTVNIKPSNTLKITFMYEDEYFKIYQYKMLVDLDCYKIEFIENKAISFIKQMSLDKAPEFETEILENLKV